MYDQSINDETKKIFQQAMLESFVNKIVIYVDRGINRLMEKVLQAIQTINVKAKEYALDTIIRPEYEKAEYLINQEAINTKSQIYNDLNKALIQQKELASVIDFFTGLLSTVIESAERGYPTSVPSEIIQVPESSQINEELRNMIQNLSKRIKEIEKVNASLKEENKKLSDLLSTYKNNELKAKSEIERLNKIIQERDEKIKQLLATVLHYKDELSKLSKGIEEEPQKDYEALLNRFKAEYAIEREKRLEIEKAFAELNKKLSNLQNEKIELEMKNKVLKNENEKIKTELSKLQNLLVTMQQEKQMLENEVSKNIKKATEYDKLVVQLGILDELLKNNPQYSALRILSSKISEGQFKISAEELGYRHGDLSLAAWFNNLFGHLKQMNIIDFEIESGRGFPKGWVIITETGKQLFINVRKKIFAEI